MKHKFYLRKKGRYKQPDGRFRYIIQEIEKGIILKEIAIPKPEKLFEMLTKVREQKKNEK